MKPLLITCLSTALSISTSYAQNMDSGYTFSREKHIEKFGHLFADKPKVSAEELKELHYRGHTGDVKAMEKLAFLYWNDNMGVEFKPESGTGLWGCKAGVKGSNAGKLMCSLHFFYVKTEVEGNKDIGVMELLELKDRMGSFDKIKEMVKNHEYLSEFENIEEYIDNNQVYGVYNR